MKCVTVTFVNSDRYAHLDADCLVREDGYLQAWKGDHELVGIFKLSAIETACVTEKGEEKNAYKR
jgi:hypothetical protein